jgi:hypothetical protein
VLVSVKLGWTGGRWLPAPGPIQRFPLADRQLAAYCVEEREGDR